MNIKKIVLLGFLCIAGYHDLLRSEIFPKETFANMRTKFRDEDIINAARRIEDENVIRHNRKIRQNFNNADLMRLSQKQYELWRGFSNGNSCVLGDLVTTVSLGYVIIKSDLINANGGEQTTDLSDDPMANLNKHQIWYKRDESSEERTLQGEIAESGTFAVTHLATNYVANTLSNLEGVKNKPGQLSEKSHHFLFKNVRMITSAAAGRTARILVEEGKNGLNSDNFQQFHKDVFRHITAEFTNEYIAPALVNMIPVDKNSWQKDVAHGVFNIAAFFLIDFLCKKQ